MLYFPNHRHLFKDYCTRPFMVHLIVKNNVKKAVEEFDKEKVVTNVADEVASELNFKVEQMLRDAIKRAKANNRKTLLARDL